MTLKLVIAVTDPTFSLVVVVIFRAYIFSSAIVSPTEITFDCPGTNKVIHKMINRYDIVKLKGTKYLHAEMMNCSLNIPSGKW